MIYASSKEELKKRLVGLACEIQGSDQGDVEFQEVCALRYADLFCLLASCFVLPGVGTPWNASCSSDEKAQGLLCLCDASDVLAEHV